MYQRYLFHHNMADVIFVKPRKKQGKCKIKSDFEQKKAPLHSILPILLRIGMIDSKLPLFFQPESFFLSSSLLPTIWILVSEYCGKDWQPRLNSIVQNTCFDCYNCCFDSAKAASEARKAPLSWEHCYEQVLATILSLRALPYLRAEDRGNGDGRYAHFTTNDFPPPLFLPLNLLKKNENYNSNTTKDDKNGKRKTAIVTSFIDFERICNAVDECMLSNGKKQIVINCFTTSAPGVPDYSKNYSKKYKNENWDDNTLDHLDHCFKNLKIVNDIMMRNAQVSRADMMAHNNQIITTVHKNRDGQEYTSRKNYQAYWETDNYFHYISENRKTIGGAGCCPYPESCDRNDHVCAYLGVLSCFCMLWAPIVCARKSCYSIELQIESEFNPVPLVDPTTYLPTSLLLKLIRKAHFWSFIPPKLRF